MKFLNLHLSKQCVKVDDEDYERCSTHTWRIQKEVNKITIRSYINGKSLNLGRFILGASTLPEVDHKDRDPFNNQKENLRNCTRLQNAINRGPRKNSSSKYKGVSLDKKSGKWRAQIYINGKQYSIGSYNTAKEAAINYNSFAKTKGEFAFLNDVEQ